MTTAVHPPIVLVDTDGGSALIRVDGVETRLTASSMPDVVRQAVQHIASTVATPFGGPVTVWATDPANGTSTLSIDPSGAVTALAPTPIPEARPHVEETARLDTTPAEAPSAAVEPAPANEPAPASVAPDADGAELAPDAAAAVPQTRREARLTARDFALSKPAPKTGPALEGWQGSLNRVSGGALRLSPGTAEVTRRDRRNSIQRGIAGHKTIAVIGEKGGVGKTTTTYMLGAVLGRVRGGTILAWDNNEFNGTLGDRSYEAAHDHTARDLLGHIDTFTAQAHQAELVNFVRPQRDNKFDVLASQSLDSATDVIDADAFRKLHAALSRFYRVIVVDTGNNSKATTWQAAVEAADQLVLTSLAKEDASRKIASLADTLVEQGYADKLANAVTLIGHTSPVDYPELEQRLRDHMGKLTRAVVSVPFDPGFDQGDVIEYAALGRESQEAWIAAAAAVMDGLR
ncbi:MinD/ParA family protein [Clavibacter zhangzhiyongii]|uniref:MinD/ParA family ATP-binding protein n=1 Tax=Clavibacter zhangzhiyongii TaxID=2768071 RepID=UPI00195AEA04|nr:AAA family ATPase [Clavibacter zhangzhiyongii]MBM7024507.1 AAA family ATPase [Clavibacter zhangzhiyongii]